MRENRHSRVRQFRPNTRSEHSQPGYQGRRPAQRDEPIKARRYSRPVEYQIAQVNVGRLLAPRDSPQLAGFFAALDPVNAAADRAPGFVWRLQTEEGNATAITAFEWDRGDSHGVLINMSVWNSVKELAAFVYGELHRSVLLQRRTWFQTVAEPTTCLWWVPAGHRPSTDEAEERVLLLRAHGPTPAAFTFRHSFGPPDGDERETPRPGRPDWLCPA